ncbi:uncharacterized protein F5Z01DRAFT_748304 [Emericellopsis atlantica]|uniref:Uncharacterized protein n=1 Tax=Emericellopsis atlantica TaxID=2614577 RepID=A0A9P7ZRU2_9HYPO|nr:uncharacterized protein F5Z01DRAFT_748304 [Emericellopsis atlantica]KAG9256687.1 hypothetical protein F5Z01DRAFT_748304 [Emericellopsis atlantica]
MEIGGSGRSVHSDVRDVIRVDATLGILLPALTVLLVRSSKTHPKRLSVVTAGLQSFFDAAAYFAISAPLATIVFLSMKDFGISASNFEAIESKITQIVSVVCMLPLLYPIVLLNATDEPAKHNMRVFLLNVAASLSFYTFVSRCIHWFSNTPMRTSDGDVIYMDDWVEVESICFSDGLRGLKKNRVYGSIGAVGLSAMIIVYLFTFWQNLGLLGSRHLAGRSRWQDLIFQHHVWRQWLSRHPYYATAFPSGPARALITPSLGNLLPTAPSAGTVICTIHGVRGG